MGSSTGYQSRIFGNVCIGRTTATANDVYQTFLNILFHFIFRTREISEEALVQIIFPSIGLTFRFWSTGSYKEKQGSSIQYFFHNKLIYR